MTETDRKLRLRVSGILKHDTNALKMLLVWFKVSPLLWRLIIDCPEIFAQANVGIIMEDSCHWRGNIFFVAFENENLAVRVRGSFTLDVARCSSERKAREAYMDQNVIPGIKKFEVTCVVEKWHPNLEQSPTWLLASLRIWPKFTHSFTYSLFTTIHLALWIWFVIYLVLVLFSYSFSRYYSHGPTVIK